MKILAAAKKGINTLVLQEFAETPNALVLFSDFLLDGKWILVVAKTKEEGLRLLRQMGLKDL